jgi:hypothetical protein
MRFFSVEKNGFHRPRPRTGTRTTTTLLSNALDLLLAVYGTEKRTRNDPSIKFHLKNCSNLVAATKFAILLGGTMIVDYRVVSKTGLLRHQRRRQ